MNRTDILASMATTLRERGFEVRREVVYGRVVFAIDHNDKVVADLLIQPDRTEAKIIWLGAASWRSLPAETDLVLDPDGQADFGDGMARLIRARLQRVDELRVDRIVQARLDAVKQLAKDRKLAVHAPTLDVVQVTIGDAWVKLTQDGTRPAIRALFGGTAADPDDAPMFDMNLEPEAFAHVVLEVLRIREVAGRHRTSSEWGNPPNDEPVPPLHEGLADHLARFHGAMKRIGREHALGTDDFLFVYLTGVGYEAKDFACDNTYTWAWIQDEANGDFNLWRINRVGLANPQRATTTWKDIPYE